MRMRPICRTTSRNLDRCKAGHPVGSSSSAHGLGTVRASFSGISGAVRQSLETPDISRLTYNGLNAFAGEYFQRIDSPYKIFIKGNIGLGSIYTGHQNDEDWLLFGGTVGYSNTLSDSIKAGKLGYTTLDLGYDVLRGAGYRVGPFVGYNYFTERWDTYGCVQIANPASDCVGNFAQPTTVLIGTQDSTWNSLRVGLTGDTMLTDRLKISADVAYLPTSG